MSRSSRLLAAGAAVVGLAVFMTGPTAPTFGTDSASASNRVVNLSPGLQQQVAAIRAEKAGRTPAQLKIESQLLYAEKKARHVPFPAHFPDLQTGVSTDARGRVVVEVRGRVTPDLLSHMAESGAQVTQKMPKAGSLRIRVPLTNVEQLAASPDVTWIAPAEKAILATGTVDSEGDATHRADDARSTFGVNGAGVKIGVLSDGVASLADSQSSGDLGTVTVLPGQAGTAGADEGTAMLEIVHDLAPGAQLYFATGLGGPATFAQNIRDLRAAGCDVIVDDIGYPTEGVFQDGPVAQAVDDVTTDGAVYFSAAGNEGNLDDGTSGVWEGDFVPYTDSFDNVWADFDPSAAVQNADPLGVYYSSHPATLKWADPLGASSNDYDLFWISADGSTVLGVSDNVQNGTQDPLECFGCYVGTSAPVGGGLLAILLYSGSPRFMDLNLNRGWFADSGSWAEYETAGQIYGHSAAVNAFGVAATPAHDAFGPGEPSGPYPDPFSTSNESETFTSDGPRRVFFSADGTPYTPGDFTSSGGVVRQKPDITAADGVATTVPGFAPFFGTSAAAPHAAAIAALLLDADPALTPAQVRTALTSTAIDIESPGWDRDTGFGIIDAFAAVESVSSDENPPQTTITSGPSGTTDDPTPTFEFTSDEPGSTFECRIDSASWVSCTSPYTVPTALPDGPHTFSVRATDVDDNTDPTPAERSFTVDTTTPVETCPGYEDDPRNQVVGTEGDDFLDGTAGADIICGLAGEDVIFGLGGDDLLIGGADGDLLFGGTGKDTLLGGTGPDDLTGGGGQDRLNGGLGNDYLYGKAGADVLLGKAGRDELYGGLLSDTMYGGGGNDLMVGGGGDDRLEGGPGDDILKGQAGNDVLVGKGGRDTLVGGLAPDTMRGGADNDLFLARDFRRDLVYGGTGRDTAKVDRVDVCVSIEIRRVG